MLDNGILNKFDGKKLLITGGTGSFGNAVLKKFLSTGISEIRIFSRDEKKQEDMRKEYANDKLKFYIGDVRDRRSLSGAISGVDFIFHAAALKQVPSCEFHPMEAVNTNIIGTDNVLDMAIYHGVTRIVCLGTDKAVYPINAMGISKAMMEKVMVAKSRVADSERTVICGTRYGNVMASRGSVIPLFVDQIRNGEPLTLTDPEMTRFMMTLDEAVELVLFAFTNGRNGEIFVQKSPASSMRVLVDAMLGIVGKPNHKVQLIGTRHGEKLYETLMSREEMIKSDDMDEYYRVLPDLRDLNYSKYVDSGETALSASHDYTSHNADQLDIASMSDLLMSLPLIQELRRSIPPGSVS